MASLLNTKDIEDHYLDMAELGEDPHVCGERFIRTFCTSWVDHMVAVGALYRIEHSGGPDYAV